ncbi:hypothetical protein SLS64_012342 [Diaporthe eres]
MTDSSTSRRPSSAGSDLSVDSQDPTVSLKRVGLSKEFAITKSGTSYVRKINPDGTKTAWKKVEAPPTNTQPDSRTKQLYLVRHNQAEGEPFHWSLETADVEGGDLEGNVYQVSGDAEFMDYRPNQDGVPVPTLSNPDIRDVSHPIELATHPHAPCVSSMMLHYFDYTLADPVVRQYFVLVPKLTPDLEDIVKKVAAAEPPPQAKSRKEVKENCQYWAIRVMKKLVDLGMMDTQKVVDCQNLLEPVRK